MHDIWNPWHGCVKCISTSLTAGGLPVSEEDLYVPHYRRQCGECAMKLVCNGCSDCGRCDQ